MGHDRRRRFVALERNEIPYEIAEGEGAFYGPKIDLHGGRAGTEWQMGTIQLDSQMPARFGLTYMGADNAEHRCTSSTARCLARYERFIGILVEHYAGAFPLWLAPVQLRIIPVGEDHREAARALAEKLSDFRVEVDDSDETVGKRIGTPRWRRSRTRSSTATGSRRTRWQSGSAAASNRHEVSTNW